MSLDEGARRAKAASASSTAVRVTALSATSVELLFTDVALKATFGVTGQFATGQLILNGTITVKRVYTKLCRSVRTR